MKRCPVCERTFEDTFTFCLIDGSVLSAPFDPTATQPVSRGRDTNSAPTEVLQPSAPTDETDLPRTLSFAPPIVQTGSPAAGGVTTTAFAPTAGGQPADNSGAVKEKPAAGDGPGRRRILQFVGGTGIMFILGIAAHLIDDPGRPNDWIAMGFCSGIIGSGTAIFISNRFVGFLASLIGGALLGLIIIRTSTPNPTEDYLKLTMVVSIFSCFLGWAMSNLVAAKLARNAGTS